MSDEDEISEVYQQEIDSKTNQVKNKRGIIPFLEDFDGFTTFDLYDLTDEDKELLRLILENDSQKD